MPGCVGLANIVASRYAAVTAAAQTVQSPANNNQFCRLCSGTHRRRRLSVQLFLGLGWSVKLKLPLPLQLWLLVRPLGSCLAGSASPQENLVACILSSLYTTIGDVGRVPSGFLDGMIVPVLRKPNGISTDVDNYRPLQMLNCDHRLLATVLANRLAFVETDAIISLAQSAFVPNRPIGDRLIASGCCRCWPRLSCARNNAVL
jgi:hypothetical protein